MTTTYDLTEFYSPGDLIEITDGTTTSTGYILSIAPGSTSGSTAYIVKTTGSIFNLISGAVTFHVITPNRTNRLSETMQSMVTKKPVLVTPELILLFQRKRSSRAV